MNDSSNISRSEYALKNATVALLMQLVKNILAFVGRTVFVRILGTEYLGVNSLFSDILTVLSFAELGVGNAMVFSLYKPVFENDYEKIKSLMRFYERAYKIIGTVIAALGICVIPFLKFIIEDTSYVNENIIILYILFLMNSVISYFFVYKRSIIIVSQKNYLIEIYQQIFYCLQIILQSLFLVITRAFFSYLIIMICITIVNNLYISYKADRLYPYLREKDIKPLEKEELGNIITRVKALILYKIGSIAIEGTDSIFISVLINVDTVGRYANYKMIINVFRTVGNQLFGSMAASIGNLNASDDANNKEDVFDDLMFICAWFFGFTTVGLCCFLTPLVKIWLGDSFTIAISPVIAACVYFFISSMHYPCYSFRETTGLFVQGKYVPIIASILNIAMDVIMGKNGD